ncbi:hypothetical protein Tco_1167408, partial [Tanacetum coccineum]
MLEDPYAEAALQAPPSPDYVPGPEEPEQAPPSPDYVPGPEHDDDEIVAEDQPYAEDASPIARSPDYVPETDHEASPEEDEPFETDESAATPPPHPSYRMTARITIPEPLPVPAWSDSEVARLLVISSPPASPLSPWSSSPPQIPFLVSPPPPVLTAPPPSPIRSLGYRATTIRMRAEAAATSHSLPAPPPFPTSPTTPFLPLHREDRPEVNLPPRIGLGLAPGHGYEVRESSAADAARPAGG